MQAKPRKTAVWEYDAASVRRKGVALNEIAISEFKYAIHKTHGSRSQLLRREHVHETFEGETVWEGEVLVFGLLDHPSSSKCYAWEVDGQVTTVLHKGPVDSPLAAVRASIPAEESDG